MMGRALAAALAGLLLTACTDDVPVNETSLYTVTGEIGAIPTVVLESPLPFSDPTVEILIEGDGQEIGDNMALLSITTFSGTDGAIVGVPAEPSLVQPADISFDGALRAALIEATEGSRIAVTWAVAGEDGGKQMEIVVVDVLPTIATGEPQEIDFAAENLPEVSGDLAPEATMGEGTREPSELRALALLKGAGTQVLPGDDVYAQYTVWEWDTGEIVDSTWEAGGVPTMIEIDDAFPGLRDGILDQTVGSRVLVLIPPDQGIGTDSLVAIVDILAVGRAS